LPEAFAQVDGGRQHVVAIALIAGVLSFIWIPLGQPVIANRAMAARDARSQWVGGWVLMSWLTVALPGLLLLGWFGRVLYDGLPDANFLLLEVPARLLHPIVPTLVGMIVMGTLLTNVAASIGLLSTAFTSDLRPQRALPASEWARAMAVVIVIAVLLLAHFLRRFTLDDLTFCWTALGAAIAPLLLVRVSGKRVRGGSILGAMSAGFMLVCVFHVIPDAPGDFLERVLPFVAALGIALSGGERRRNPDRADRDDQTVHDRLPI
jgi:sodium/proline symporter